MELDKKKKKRVSLTRKEQSLRLQNFTTQSSYQTMALWILQ